LGFVNILNDFSRQKVHLIYKFPLFCNKVLTHTKKCVIISRIEYPFEAFGMKKPIAEGTLENLILSAEGARRIRRISQAKGQRSFYSFKE